MFLSDLNISYDGIDLYKDILLITASCGYGKNYYVNDLSEKGLLYNINKTLKTNSEVPIEPSEMLILTSRRMKKEQELKKNNDKLTERHFAFGDDKDKIMIRTLHKFGEDISRNETREYKNIKLLVIDEIHTLFFECDFAEQLQYVLKYLEDNYNKLIKVGLSATSEIATLGFSDIFTFKVINDDLPPKYKSHNIAVAKSGSAETVVKQIADLVNDTNKVLVYIQSAKKCVELAEQYNGGFIVSIWNKDYSGMMKAKGYFDYIVENEVFPPGINIMFVNASARESINIKDENVKTIIVEAVDLITIEQVIGRIRNNVDNIYVIMNGVYRNMNEKNYKMYQEFIRKYKENREKTLDEYNNTSDGTKRSFVRSKNGKVEINKYVLYKYEYMKATYDLTFDKNLTSISYSGRTKENIDKLIKYTERNKIDDYNNIKDLIKAINNIKCIVPDEYLNVPLYKAEKDELCEKLSLSRDYGRKAGWTTTKKYLLDNGYKLDEKRKNNKRYTIISRVSGNCQK